MHLRILPATTASTLLLLLVFAMGGAQVVEHPAATDYHGGFALQDVTGRRLLLPLGVTRPELLTAALCSPGSRAPVKYESRQGETSNTGRHTPANFSRLAGEVFAINGTAVSQDATCFVASDSLLTGSTVWTLAPPTSAEMCTQRDRLAQLRDRAVTRCWTLARVASDKEVLLVEFMRRGQEALASFVVVDGAHTMFAEFHSEFRGEGRDLWRVDDGGVLSPEGISVLAVIQRGTSYALATQWDGAEGRLLSLWASDAENRLEKVINDYWYRAPTQHGNSRSPRTP